MARSRRVTRLSIRRAGAAAVLLACAGSARAQSTTWTNPAGGDWITAANWSGGQVPDGSLITYFDTSVGNGLTFTVAMNGSTQASRTLNAWANAVTLDFTNATANYAVGGGAVGTESLVVGRYAGVGAILTVLNTGATQRLLTAVDGAIGSVTIPIGPGPTSQFIVRGSKARASFSSSLKVGAGATGVMTVDQAASVTCAGLRVGTSTSGSGSLTVDGDQSLFNYGSSCVIGENGPATVILRNGGQIFGMPTATIAIASTSSSNHPSATVTIDGSTWPAITNSPLEIGKYGTGQIILTNNGVLATSNQVRIGYFLPVGGPPSPYTLGLVEIGAGCVWNHSGGNIQVGFIPSAAISPTPSSVTLKGGQLSLGSQSMLVNPGGALLGHGTITGTGTVAAMGGLVSPDGGSPGTYGTLTINGTLNTVSGKVQIDIRGDDAGPHDAIVIGGAMPLGGTLQVNSAGSLPDPGNTLSLPLITAGSFTGSAFPVAYLPGLPDNRFYKVVYPGAGGGTITLAVQSLFSTPGFGGGSANTSVAATVTAADRGDLSGDGLDDLAVTTSDGFVFVLINNGDGTFSQVTQLPVGSVPKGVVIADLDPSNPNNNGKEIIVSNSGSNTLTVYSRTGAGAWFVAATPSTGSTPLGLCAADFDADGKVDLCVANNTSNTVSMMRGNSTSSISLLAQTQHGTDNGPVDVDPWDPDNTKSGSKSIVTANSNSGTNTSSMSFLLNNGGGGFNAPANFATGTGPFQVLTGDLNRDGKSDVITANADGMLTVFISDGANSFLAGAPVAVGDSPLSMARADLDLDGDLDIVVVANNESDTPVVKVLRNDTDPFDNNLTLAAPVEVTTPTPRIVLTGKVDGDSRPDIMTIGSGARTLTTVTTVANSSLCPSDYDQNGFVNGDDFDAFVIEFYYGTILADFDHNGFVNGDDFDGFTAAFEAGC